MCACIIALVIRHAKRTLRVVLSTVACSASPYFFFFAIHHKVSNFWENAVEHKKRVSIFYTLFFLKYFSFYEEFRDIISCMYIGTHVQHTLFLSEINKT